MMTIACGGLAALAAAACSPANQGDEGAPPPQVIAIAADEETVRDTISIVGTLEANEAVTIQAETEGPIRTIHFDEGETVEADQVLIRLDREKLQAEVDQAAADFRLSEINYRRRKQLYEDELISEHEFDQAESTFQARQADLNLKRRRLEDTVIRAPFSGIMGERRVSPGQVITKNQTLAELVDLDPVKLALNVPERFLGDLEIGQSVETTVPAYPDQAFEGSVYFIAPQVNPQTRNALVKGRIPNPDGRLKPGMFGEVQLTTEIRSSAVVVPEASIVRDADQTYVFVVGDGNEVQRREVALGVRLAGRVELRNGLKAGETIIVEGIQKVRPGGQVRLAPEEESAPYRQRESEPLSDTPGT